MTLRLEPIVEGATNGPTLFFIQGWPDDASVWDGTVGAVGERYRCVRVNLPNAGDGPRARWGFRTDEVVDALAEVARRVGGGRPLTLVLHDWGAYWGYMLHHRYPELVARVAGLDIAPHFRPKPGAMLALVAYQGYLASAFLLGGPIGDAMTRSFASLVGAPLARERIHAGMNFPYRNVWDDLASGRAERNTKGYWPTVPLLFVYGTRKPFPFHSRRWVEHVKSVGGEVVALDTGHWVQHHPDFDRHLGRWLEATDARA